MIIKFWGVRGSIASPGAQTVRYGGNTSCVEVTLSDGTTLVLDGGTGLRRLGLDFRANPRRMPLHMLLSHHHWDHIQGFPFFAPIYDPGAEICLYPFRDHGAKILSMLDQMDGAHFPVTSKNLPAKIRIVETEGKEVRIGPARVELAGTNHPGGGLAFRIEEGGHSLVYITDNELEPPEVVNSFDSLARFCRGAELLVVDAQYAPEDFPAKRGWGHSSFDQALELGAAAGARCVALFHHDPQRSDEELDAIGALAAAFCRRRGQGMRCFVAAEGMSVELNSKGIQPEFPSWMKAAVRA